MGKVFRRARVLLLAGCVALAGCAKREQLYAAPVTLAGNVRVQVYDVYGRGERIYVKSTVANDSGARIVVDRDEWALRLPTGEVLRRSIGLTTQHIPYTLEPGTQRTVYVDFRKEGADLGRMADGSALIVGGIGFGTDPTPRVIGEVAIGSHPTESQALSPFPAGGPAPFGSEQPTASAPPATASPVAAPGTPAPDVQAASLRLEPGLTRDQVVALMGSPGATEFGTPSAGQPEALTWRYDVSGRRLVLVFAKSDDWRLASWSWP
jgi:hypothetical protein